MCVYVCLFARMMLCVIMVPGKLQDKIKISIHTQLLRKKTETHNLHANKCRSNKWKYAKTIHQCQCPTPEVITIMRQ